MPEDKFETTHPSRLAQMLAPHGAVRWRPEELGPIFRHQMSVELKVDLPEGALENSPPTFGDLLHHPSPSLEMLHRVKRYAKACKVTPEGPLPPEVATVLYFASIVVALLRYDARISELDDKAVRTGTEWALTQTWLDPQTRSIFEEAAAKLAPSA